MYILEPSEQSTVISVIPRFQSFKIKKKQTGNAGFMSILVGCEPFLVCGFCSSKGRILHLEARKKTHF